MHVNGPPKGHYKIVNVELRPWKDTTNYSKKKKKSVATRFLKFAFSYQELALQRFLNTFIYNTVASSKNTNKTSHNSRTSEEGNL